LNKDIISKKTRCEFREHFVNYYLREIEQEFDAADVAYDENYNPNLSGARRSLAEKYYHTINWQDWNDVKKILKVYENTLLDLENQARGIAFSRNTEWAKKSFESLKRWLMKDGFIYTNGKIIHSGHYSSLQDVSKTTAYFDGNELQWQIERMRNAVDSDPSLAIGTAKELIETTCKTILSELNIKYAKNDDIMRLVKKTQACLGVIPEKIPESAKGSEIIKRLLSNLGSITQCLGELRNLYGTGHGREGRMKGLNPRHARLAVGSAATLVTFLFETYIERVKISK